MILYEYSVQAGAPQLNACGWADRSEPDHSRKGWRMREGSWMEDGESQSTAAPSQSVLECGGRAKRRHRFRTTNADYETLPRGSRASRALFSASRRKAPFHVSGLHKCRTFQRFNVSTFQAACAPRRPPRHASMQVIEKPFDCAAHPGLCSPTNETSAPLCLLPLTL
jgi:hypothetical protein